MTRCSQNKTFTKKGLSVQSLEPTEQIAVEGLPDCPADFLIMYFENAGGDIEDVILNEEEQSAIITLKDPKGSAATVQIENNCEYTCSVTKTRDLSDI